MYWSCQLLFRVTMQSEGQAVRGGSTHTSRTSEELQPRRLRTHGSMSDAVDNGGGPYSAKGLSDESLCRTAAAPTAAADIGEDEARMISRVSKCRYKKLKCLSTSEILAYQNLQLLTTREYQSF